MKDNIYTALKYIREKTDFVPRVGMTLGSGLGNFADKVNKVCEIPFDEIPEFPVSTVPGHEGKFVLGYIGTVPVMCMKGRVHYYEGYDMDQVVMPARIMHSLGAQIMLLTNAAGGIKDDYYPGALALITDHVSLFVKNPLIGPNDADEGVRFQDMSCPYDLELRRCVQKAAEEEGIELKEGVYAQLTGPSFETPAEIRFLRTCGVDLVGMSTVVETIVARHMGMRVVGISLVSNLASGLSHNALSHEEVQVAGKQAEEKFSRLVYTAIQKF
ncbi:MAG: purine-nucleoside phosphorylase [Lachnospiraceae bacterium]|nr:purine-nucleoside phosphorylase [Lachnospiraceae bacterium]